MYSCLRVYTEQQSFSTYNHIISPAWIIAFQEGTESYAHYHLLEEV